MKITVPIPFAGSQIAAALIAAALLVTMPLKQESNHRFVLNDAEPYAFTI